MSLERNYDYVWCEYHEEVHREIDLYKDKYGLISEESECSPEVWRKLWIGGHVND